MQRKITQGLLCGNNAPSLCLVTHGQTHGSHSRPLLGLMSKRTHRTWAPWHPPRCILPPLCPPAAPPACRPSATFPAACQVNSSLRPLEVRPLTLSTSAVMAWLPNSKTHMFKYDFFVGHQKLVQFVFGNQMIGLSCFVRGVCSHI